MSVVSSTDVDIFRRLSNPEVVDVNDQGATTRQIAAQMRQAIVQAVASRDTETSGPAAPISEAERKLERQASAAKGPSLLAQAMSSVVSNKRAVPVSAANEDEPGSASQAQENEPKAGLEPMQPAAATAAAAVRHHEAPQQVPFSALSGTRTAMSAREPASLPVSSPQVAQNFPAAPASVPAARAPCQSQCAASVSASDDENEPEAPAPQDEARDPETMRIEKQGFLIELQALERKGVRLSRRFTMQDSVAELEFEVQKQNSALSTQNAVVFMRDVLRLCFNGVEIANSKLGPLLILDGWAESMTGDMARFDNVLERLYKRYWRKQQMSPVMELAWVILGSLVAHHFKARFFGPPRPSARAPEERAREAQSPSPGLRAFQERSVPRASGGPRAASAAGAPQDAARRSGSSAQQGSRAASGNQAQTLPSRPTLRPPSALFGL